jgi:hypothetical protein
LIGQLLPLEGETPQPAALNRGQPLVAQAPSSGVDLAPSLQKAVSQSGLFYEAHQAQWVAGDRLLTSLRAEPQGQLPAMPRQTPASSLAGPGNTTASESQGMIAGARPESAAQLRQTASGQAEQSGSAYSQNNSGAERASTGTSALSGSNTSAIPDGIRPLVQQQLDAVATQRLAWSGEVWPGQTLDWTIERELIEEREAAPESGDIQQWTTSLRLSMPRLGVVGATLQLSGDRLRLRVIASGDNVASDLRRQAPELAQALENAGLTLQTVDIRHE